MPLPRKLGLWLMLAVFLGLAPLAIGGVRHLLVVMAIRKGNQTSLRGLLREGGDVNARNGEGMTPLMIAAHAGDTAFARELLARGADVNAQDERYSSALYLAADHGHLGTVKLLRKSGASLRGRAPIGFSDDSDTPRKAAAVAGHKEIAQLLARDERLSRRLLAETQQVWTQNRVGPLDPARIQRWKGLLEQGADPNWRDINGNSVAAVTMAGDLEGLRLMFVYKGDPKSVSSGGDDLMTVAAVSGTPAMLELLRQKGLPVNTDSWLSPLWRAVTWPRLDNVRYLLEHGANPNTGHQGVTLLEEAKGKVIKPLPPGTPPEAGRPPEKPEDWVYTDRPLSSTQKAIVELLKKHGARE